MCVGVQLAIEFCKSVTHKVRSSSFVLLVCRVFMGRLMGGPSVRIRQSTFLVLIVVKDAHS